MTKLTKGESACGTASGIRKTDRLEYWVRFVCGAIAGALVGLDLFLNSFASSAVLVLGTVGVILGFGFASARFGDKFWHSIFRR
jgi:uncharacterized membrane protein YoaK (UPF0700 family)